MNPHIRDPSAFDLLTRQAISLPMPVMYNPVGPDNRTLFEVAQWAAIRNKLDTMNSTAPQESKLNRDTENFGSWKLANRLCLAVALNLRCFSGGLGEYPQKPEM